jgi:aspartate ammonia-lyase
MTKTRTEKDSLGPREVPADALYGVQTLRASENFKISGQTLLPEMIVAYGHLKKACAQANKTLTLLPVKMATLIIEAADEIVAGEHGGEFIVDVFQAGAGTSTNMNVNEVIANRVLEMMGEEKGRYDLVSPNDHVNMAQSTNDTYPTAMRIAMVMRYAGLDKQLEALEKAFAKKAAEFRTVIKSARTHLQDAVPITLGQEFKAYARTMKGLRKQLAAARDSAAVIGIGGSAAGTGLNVHPRFSKCVVQNLNKNTGLTFKKAPDLVESMQSQRQILEFSMALKQIAVEMSRIASDLRLLSSGPNTGFAELTLPAVQPGSSIMPGKINPSILECVNMTCYRVMGSEHTVEHCVHGGQMDLNVNMPLMSYELLTSMRILGNTAWMMADKCVSGITADRCRSKQYAYESASLATALNPIIGYNKVAEVVKEFVKTKKPIPDIVLEKGILTQVELKRILNPKKMTRPGIAKK